MVNIQHELIVDWHLVVFLDALEQREKLRNLPCLSKSDPKLSQTIGALTETASSVLRFRRFFQKNFEMVAESIGRSHPLTLEQKDKIEKIKRAATQCTGISDSFIFSVALRNDAHDRLTPAVGLFASLVAAAAAMSLSLANKRPLRGGIDIGLGVNLTPNEVYGPALESACFLGGSAKHPVILIGDVLWNYITVIEAENAKAAYGDLAREHIRKVKELIVTDQDGRRALDYLGSGVHAVFNRHFAMDLIEPAYEYVVHQHQLFKANGNENLRDRYAKVIRYFDMRLGLWRSGT